MPLWHSNRYTLLIVWHNVSTDPVYSVTMVTDPPSGPHPIESTVNLTCLIHPQPPEDRLTYQWRDYFSKLTYWQRGYLQYISLAVANSSLPYATLSIMRDHPHTASYHCRVYKVDCNFYISLRYATPNSIATSVLCVGLLSPIGPTTVQYSTLDTVILRVNITPTATFTYL